MYLSRFGNHIDIDIGFTESEKLLLIALSATFENTNQCDAVLIFI
jgi:hypothetical protein